MSSSHQPTTSSDAAPGPTVTAWQEDCLTAQFGPAIADHAFLSDQRTGALVTREGVIDWLCMPSFDSPAILTALLGTLDHGHWRVAVDGGRVEERRYVEDTLVLETTWRGPHGKAVVTDFMPIIAEDVHGDRPPLDRSDVIRTVRCTEGEVDVVGDFAVRFWYGQEVPWLRHGTDADGEHPLVALAGADAIALHGPDYRATGQRHSARTHLDEGDSASWSLTWFHSWQDVPTAPDAEADLAATIEHWRDWMGSCTPRELYGDQVRRSLLVLRGLTNRLTSGVIAALTTSLPESYGGERNWDYRYTWLRDAALSLEVLLHHGHTAAARGWRDWLLRAVAGDPDKLQIMYTVTGARHIPEQELDHLPGYADSRPVRRGNGAVSQFQADVVGETMIALDHMRRSGIEETDWSWSLQRELVEYCLDNIDHKGQGLWEMRGEPQHFTLGRIMMWTTLDRAIRGVEEFGLPADADDLARWRHHRDALREEVFSHGVDEDGAFTQTYATTEVDAALLQVPRTGFVAGDDPHMLATVRRIEQDLVTDSGLVLRYRTSGQDGLSGHEYPFTICGFWLVEQYARTGRTDDARTLFERLLGCANDLGLMSEEYDDVEDRMAGNFPQAFSHLGLVRAASALDGDPVD